MKEDFGMQLKVNSSCINFLNLQELQTHSLSAHSYTSISFICSDVNKWDFDIFAFQKLCNGWPLLCLSNVLFLKLNIEQNLGIDRNTFSNCVSKMENGYLSTNAYHNSLHAADVLQTANCMLRIERKSHKHNRHDVFLLLFSSIIHDYKHPGLNSQYLIKSG